MPSIEHRLMAIAPALIELRIVKTLPLRPRQEALKTLNAIGIATGGPLLEIAKSGVGHVVLAQS